MKFYRLAHIWYFIWICLYITILPITNVLIFSKTCNIWFTFTDSIEWIISFLFEFQLQQMEMCDFHEEKHMLYSWLLRESSQKAGEHIRGTWGSWWRNGVTEAQGFRGMNSLKWMLKSIKPCVLIWMCDSSYLRIKVERLGILKNNSQKRNLT